MRQLIAGLSFAAAFFLVSPQNAEARYLMEMGFNFHPSVQGGWGMGESGNGEYVDGYNLYQYVQSNPVMNIDPSGLAMPHPRPKPNPTWEPAPWVPWPWQIDDEAEKRRGCTGNDSDHHCWAVCMTTYYTGCGGIPQITRFTQDAAEVCFPSPDWKEDIYANEKGAKACAYNLSDPVSYCDRHCRTKKCR